ncbi:DUF2505 domain-containing protein [Nocardia higoensis]|uniref:DUF2505 domain-containing protein n=1 Tax=Nocardia higoensis TaxID=228599 RepID=A0ABS0DLB0_9NOCA|nr:DUF2505 domain-containing protein [Nocardia higoensis]MBF6357493.1 DUF2505 domain-containing protein [Nocardia higoensis]
MATPLAYTAAYSHPVSAVRAAFSDEQYWTDRIAEVGGPHARLESVTAQGDTVQIHVVEVIAAEFLPPAITAVRPGDLVIPRIETWNGMSATFDATVEGAPAKMSGTIVLSGDDTAATTVVDGSIEVKVPLFGSKIEAAIRERLVELLRSEEEFTNTWLSGR